MDEKKKEKIRIIIVIGLLIVLILVAYFRFFLKKGSSDDPNSVADPAVRSNIAVVNIPPQNRIPIPGPKTRPKEGLGREGAPPLWIRDIFAAPEVPEKSKAKRQEGHAPESVPSFTLKGTIVGGRKPMAIIDNQFVSQGDMIGDYRVVEITRNRVRLNRDGHQVVLDVIKDTK